MLRVLSFFLSRLSVTWNFEFWDPDQLLRCGLRTLNAVMQSIFHLEELYLSCEALALLQTNYTGSEVWQK